MADACLKYNASLWPKAIDLGRSECHSQMTENWASLHRNRERFWASFGTEPNLVSSRPLRPPLHPRPADHPLQTRAPREYAVRRGWTIVLQVREVVSGAVQRQAREKLLEAARRREIDGVLVWRLDR